MLSSQQITYILSQCVHWSETHCDLGQNKYPTATGYLDIASCPFINSAQKDQLRTTYHRHLSGTDQLILCCEQSDSIQTNMSILKQQFRQIFVVVQQTTSNNIRE